MLGFFKYEETQTHSRREAKKKKKSQKADRNRKKLIGTGSKTTN